MGTGCNSCCCFFSLRTGSLIIAFIDLIGTLTVFIYAINLIIDIGQTDENLNQNRNYWHLDHVFSRFQIEDGRFIDSNPLLFPQVVFLTVASSTVIISDIVLFIGVLGGRLKPVAAWLWYALVTSCFTIMAIIWISVAYRKATGNWKIIIFAIFYLGFKVFFMVVVRSYANTLMGGPNYFNGVQATVQPSTLPQTYSNGQQSFYSNVQQNVYPNGQPRNPSGQPQMYPNGQPPYSSGQQQYMYPNGQPPYSSGQQQRMYPNRPPAYSSGQQQTYPNGEQAIPSEQQTYPNSQIPDRSEQPPPYSIVQPRLPPMSEIKRDL